MTDALVPVDHSAYRFEALPGRLRNEALGAHRYALSWVAERDRGVACCSVPGIGGVTFLQSPEGKRATEGRGTISLQVRYS